VRPGDGDCLILDITMPGMNGFEVLTELRRRGDALPVIIVTAHADSATRSRVAAGGAPSGSSKSLTGRANSSHWCAARSGSDPNAAEVSPGVLRFYSWWCMSQEFCAVSPI
jgi:CheY-like chemotaxis protein